MLLCCRFETARGTRVCRVDGDERRSRELAFVRHMPVFYFSTLLLFPALQVSCYVLCHRTCGHHFISEEVRSRRRHAHTYLYGYVAASSRFERSEYHILKGKTI